MFLVAAAFLIWIAGKGRLSTYAALATTPGDGASTTLDALSKLGTTQPKAAK